MLGTLNVITLIALGYIDYTSYKIPNVILCVWLGTLLFYFFPNGTTPGEIIPTVIGAFIVAGSYIPLRRIVRCSAGDFKLFVVLTVAIGVDDMLTTLAISSVTSLFPLACGVKRLPMAFITCFGYIAFLLSKM